MIPEFSRRQKDLLNANKVNFIAPLKEKLTRHNENNQNNKSIIKNHCDKNLAICCSIFCGFVSTNLILATRFKRLLVFNASTSKILYMEN